MTLTTGSADAASPELCAPRFGLKQRRIAIRRDRRRLSDIFLLVFMQYSSLVTSAGSFKWR